MISLSSVTLLALLSITFAAESIDVDSSSCPVKAGEGEYNYDPTSGKGPADWGGLKKEYAACDGKGGAQSPINLPTKVSYKPISEGPDPALKGSNFNFSSAPSNWALTCSTPGTCGSTTFGGAEFTLFNVHFHAPSEHTLNGKRYPLEAHFVHQGPGGSLAVIGTMFKYPDDEYPIKVYDRNNMEFGKSSFFRQVLNGVTNNKKVFTIFPGAVIDANLGYCTYPGSLTTPPCSEVVTWIISLNVETVSRRQVHEYAVSAGANFDGNERPIQDINNRTVTCYI